MTSRIKWSIVRSFGKVKYFNISYVILFVVPILAELHHKAASQSPLFKNLIVFPDTLVWLFAASLFYAIGIALYQYFCPPIIKRYASIDEYISNNYELFLRAHPHHRLNIVLARLDPTTDSEVKAKIESLMDQREKSFGDDRLKKERELDELISYLHPDAVQRYLVNDYHARNSEHPIVLITSFFLYVAGTLIIVGFLVRRSLYVFMVT